MLKPLLSFSFKLVLKVWIWQHPSPKPFTTNLGKISKLTASTFTSSLLKLSLQWKQFFPRSPTTSTILNAVGVSESSSYLIIKMVMPPNVYWALTCQVWYSTRCVLYLVFTTSRWNSLDSCTSFRNWALRSKVTRSRHRTACEWGGAQNARSVPEPKPQLGLQPFARLQASSHLPLGLHLGLLCSWTLKYWCPRAPPLAPGVFSCSPGAQLLCRGIKICLSSHSTD